MPATQNEAVELAQKLCPSCNEVKPLSAFYRDKSTKTGHHSECKTCTRDRLRKANERRRAEMGEDQWLLHQRRLVAESRQRNGYAAEKRSNQIRYKATATLIARHRAEFDALIRQFRYEAESAAS